MTEGTDEKNDSGAAGTSSGAEAATLTVDGTSHKKDGSHSFLRAARSGNMQKVLEHLQQNTDINTANANGLNALHLASKEGHVNIVSELLSRGAHVDDATKKGNTALHIASLAGQLEVVKVLIEMGAKVNVQSQNGFTPLYMAAQENHIEVVKVLMANGASQTLSTQDGFTPLAVALQQGHEKVVALLLESDARGKVRLPALHSAAKKDDVKAAALLLNNGNPVDQQSSSGFTPLHIAAHYGNNGVASLLLDRGAEVNFQAKNNITPLHVAAKWGRNGMAVRLIQAGAQVDCKTRDGLTPLHCASRSGHGSVVDTLLMSGSNFSAKTRNGLSALHMTAQDDHVECARLLTHAGANVDDITVDYLTPLHVAAHCGNVRVAKLLLDRKCEVNPRARNGFTPLHIACKKNRMKVVELLLKYGALIEATTESGLTPLHVSAFMGHMNIVLLLLQHGANSNTPTMRGETALHLATRSNQLEIVRMLLRNNAIVDAKARENQTPLHIASRLGNVDVVTVLLQHGANPDVPTKDNYTALHIAAKEGQEEVVAVLLDRGAKLDSNTKKGFTPLHIAAKYGKMRVARLLLERGANPSAEGKNGLTPLHLATHFNNSQVALLLLEHKALPHAAAKNGYTPLHIAAKKNRQEIAINLIEYGADTNAQSRNGFTPLHLACQEGHTDMISLLLQNGAEVDFKAKNGLTGMHLAAQEDRIPVAEILVKHTGHTDLATKAGYTPLHTACHFSQLNMIRYLLGHECKVDAQTNLGFTPLHLAAQQGHLQVVRALLDAHADPNITNNNGWTAAHIARRQHYLNIFEVLRRVTTVVESWEEIEEEIMTTSVEPARPDTFHEHTFSESEDEGATPELRKRPFRTRVEESIFDEEEELELRVRKRPTASEAQGGLEPSDKRSLIPKESFRLSASNEYLLREMDYMPNRFDTASSEGRSLTSTSFRSTTDSAAADKQPNRYKVVEVDAYQVAVAIDADTPETVESITPSSPPWASPFRGPPRWKAASGGPSAAAANSGPGRRQGAVEMGQKSPWASGEAEYTVIPPSPLFSRQSASPSEVYRPYFEGVAGSGLAPAASAAAPPGGRSSKSCGASDKHSTASGEDSIYEGAVVSENRELNYLLNSDSTYYQRDDIVAVRSAGAYAEIAGRTSSELDFAPDNVPIARKPVTSGFLVSFLVDARGGAMRGSRHPGLRIIVPPSAASMPTRVTCRMLRPEKVLHPPAFNDGEGLACRVLEMGPSHCRFNSPVLLEVPHFAAMRGREREIVIMRSDNGETWKEHPMEATEQAVHDALGSNFEPLESNEECQEKRIVRILTSDFPQFFALVSRIRQETALIGADGGVISSTVVSQAQAVFPEGALQKRIRVGLQACPIPPELVAKLLGNRVAVSPIVTIEPRRRKFHKPITLTIPLPRGLTKGMINPPGSHDPHNQSTLRLLCSITGGTAPATWEDITGSTPLSVVKDCVSFTTTVSARLWLVDTQHVHESTEMASRLYREAMVVPYMSKFVVFAKRRDPEEAQLRCFCITDDKVDKTLECQEAFELMAASPEVEVLDNRPSWLEMAGNLVPMAKTGEQLNVPFSAFRENRLALCVRLKDPHQEAVGKVAFMRDSRSQAASAGDDAGMAGGGPQKPICTLEVRLPQEGAHDGVDGEHDHHHHHHLDQTIPTTLTMCTDAVAKADLDLREVAEELGCDWSLLARELGVAQSEVTQLKLAYRADGERAYEMLALWLRERGDKAGGNDLERGLRRIGREDVIKKCMRNIEYVTEEEERAEAKARMGIVDGSGSSSERNSAHLTAPYPPKPLVSGHDNDLELDHVKDTAAAEKGADAELEEALVVAARDDRRGVAGNDPDEDSEEKAAAKTAAFLDLIDRLEETAPALDLKDDDDEGDEVPEEPVTQSERDQAPPADLSPLLERLTAAPAHMTAPEREEVEEETQPMTAADVHASPNAEEGPPSPPPSPNQLIDASQMPAHDPYAERRESMTEKEHASAEAEAEALSRSRLSSSSSSPSEDNSHAHVHHRDVRETHERIEGRPEEETRVEEFEEELDDGTVVRREVRTTQTRQEVTERVVTEGCLDDVEGLENMALTNLEGDPEATEEVEEVEEELEDGTIVRKRIVRRRVVQRVLLTGDAAAEADSPEDGHPLGSLMAGAEEGASGAPPVEEETEEVLPDGSVRTRRVVVRQHCHSHASVEGPAEEEAASQPGREPSGADAEGEEEPMPGADRQRKRRKRKRKRRAAEPSRDSSSSSRSSSSSSSGSGSTNRGSELIDTPSQFSPGELGLPAASGPEAEAEAGGEERSTR